MAEICTCVVEEVAGCLVDLIKQELDYLFNYRRNYIDLIEEMGRLDGQRERLQILVDEANRQGEEIFSDVRVWLTDAESIIQKREEFIKDEKEASKSCFYLNSRRRLGEKAKTQAKKIASKILEADNFSGRISHRLPPPPFISSASFKDYEALQSRESTFNQIMEALRNEHISMIGVWGMGGVGKTTLVKQVAKQAEEDKLFHKVVMALQISPTPNIAEIQGKIASMLGLTLENNNERAVLLRQSLKKQEKILVILDDIWEKLELGEIGIPYRDDHKGCKVLLTSREHEVLSKDMRTQKEFHLEHLSEEEAWNLFKKTAGDSVEKLDLRPIAVDVAKKCEGLPVAIVTVAKALRDEKDVHVWKNALEELRSSADITIRGVTKEVYSCLELSYNHLDSDEVKSLFLLCGLLGDGDISMDRLLQHAMGLNLFKGIYSWDKATNKLITLVKNLKASSLLLGDEDGGDEAGYDDRYSSLFFDHAIVRMHDVVRDVARSIGSKDPHRFVVRGAVGSQEAVDLREWQTDVCGNCTRISLICRNMDELAQGLVCPQLEFFLLNSSNDDGDSYLKIPDDFFQDTKQLRVLDLSEVSLTGSPSSLCFLSNLRTLCLNQCWIQDIAVIGELKKLQVLILAESKIIQLPKEVMQLSDLRVLDLRNCYKLRVIPRNVISSLSRLEYLSMNGSSCFEWESGGFNTGERINACLSELKHLSGLRTLEVQVSDPSLLLEDDVPFDNLNLTRYSIGIGSRGAQIDMAYDEYKASRRLSLEGLESLHMVKCFSKLLKRSQVVHLSSLNDTKHVVYELDKEGFVELKYLTISECPTIQHILHSPSVEWVLPRNTFCMLEGLLLQGLSNLEAVCHGPIPMGSFGKLKSLMLERCERLKYVFSLPTPHGREIALPELQYLELRSLPELISFNSTRSSGSQESVTFFNQQVAFPALESMVASEDEDEDEASPLFLFPKLTSLGLISLDQLKRFCWGRFNSRWPLLKELRVDNCDKVEILFQGIGLEGELDNKIQQLLFLVEKAAFPSLESLHVDHLQNLRALWHNQIPANSFSKLKELHVRDCHKLLNVFPSNILKVLQSLQILEIYDCGALEEIFDVKGINGKEIDDIAATQSRNNLFNKYLQGLPIFQNLQSLKVNKCGCLKYLFLVSVAKTLVQLVDLQIDSCGVEAIVANEDEDEDEDEATPLFLFPKLTFLILESLPQLKRFCSGRFTSRLPLLKKLEVRKCDKVEILFQEIGLEGELDNKIQQPLFLVNKVAFPSLESLSVFHLDNVRALWHNQLPEDSFSKLKELLVIRCRKLLNVFPVSVAKALVQLKDLQIYHCRVLEAIVANEGEAEAAPLFLFPKITFLRLNGLHQLKRFCSGKFNSRWPLLKILYVTNCDKLEILFQEIGLEGELDNKIQQSLFLVEKAAFPSLESLHVDHLQNLRALWHNQIPANSFSKLKELHVRDCHKLLNVFPSNILKVLQSLQILEIYDCHALEEIFDVKGINGKEIDATAATQSRNSLFNKYVQGLPIFQNLQSLKVNKCGCLKYIFLVSVAKTLVQLVDLQIDSCGVETIVSNEDEDEDEATPLFLFPKLTFLILESLHRLERFCSGRFTSRLPLLKKLEVRKCDKVEILFQEIGLEGELDNKIQQPLFLVEKVAFPSLESLHVSYLDNVKALWHNQLPKDSFSKLKELHVVSCNKLLNVFPVSVAKALVQLEDLQIDFCGVLEGIVANENEDEAALLFLFPKLTSLKLHSLHQLKRFCFGRFTSRLCRLKKLEVRNCDKVEILFQEIGLEGELDNKIQQPLFLVEKEAFPNLEELTLTFKGTTEIWRSQFSRVSLSKLRVLNIMACHGISVVISSNMVQKLHNLEILKVSSCDSVKEIVGNEGDEPTNDEIDFTRLNSLVLDGLPNLKCFCSARYTFQFPSLAKMKVVRCPKMEVFCKGVLHTPRLRHIIDSFCAHWEGDLNTTIHKKVWKQESEELDFNN